MQNQSRKAVEAYEKAIEIDPDYAAAYCGLGELCSDNEDASKLYAESDRVGSRLRLCIL